MFGFQITKWFWNLWDHLIAIILLNLLFLALMGVFLPLLPLLAGQPLLLLLACLVALFLATTLQHAYALANYSIAKLERSNWKDSLRRSWQKPSLLAAGLLDMALLLGMAIYYVSWRFYSQRGGLLGLLALGLLFWLAVLFLLSFGFYFPLLVREEFSLRAALRQSLVISLDNPLLTVGLGLVAALLYAASLVPPLLLFIGPVGLGLWYEVALRILYYKYQYLEQVRCEATKIRKTEIPWRALLRSERERIGPRSLRNFIFPWKD